MSETNERLALGAEPASFDYGEKDFTKIDMLLEATGGLSLSQVCAVTGLEASTIQNWVKRGWVSHPAGKKYLEVHIARIMIINALKECIKLEHIALLMNYVKGSTEETSDNIIKESELFDYLCQALQKTGQEDDLSRSGVESVVEKVIKGYKGPTADARARIRKVLTLMIYACVCTDVKRRTEAMMGQILYDLEHPENLEAEAEEILEEADQEEPPVEEVKTVVETRKTVSQALREWDINNTDKTDNRSANTGTETEEKSSNRPWYFRKNTK